MNNNWYVCPGYPQPFVQELPTWYRGTISHQITRYAPLRIKESMPLDPYALVRAVHNEDLEQVRDLLDRGADVNPPLGEPPLIRAAMVGNRDIAELLLDRGANINALRQGVLFSGTALMEAATGGHMDVVDLLINRGADIDAGVGNTPLIEATQRNHIDVVNALLNAGANPNSRDTFHHTALHHASQKEIAQTLIAHGANVHARDYMGQTPLAKAAFLAKVEIVDQLIGAGADVNEPSDDETTPLMHAVYSAGSCDSIEAILRNLLDHGANPIARRSDGKTALYMAVQMNNARNHPCTNIPGILREFTNPSDYGRLMVR